MLNFDWERIDGEVVTEILGEDPSSGEDDNFQAVRVTLVTESKKIIEISVNEETDELIIKLLPEVNNRSILTDISNHIEIVGEQLGWCWTATNYRGYNDVFLLGIGCFKPSALDPKYAFVSCASEVLMFQMALLPFNSSNI